MSTKFQDVVQRLKNRWLVASLPAFLLASFVLLRYDPESGQAVDGLNISLTTDPSPPIVGVNALKSRVIAPQGFRTQTVRFSFFEVPPEYMVPQDGFVETVEASTSDGEEYRANIEFTKPGAWKVVVTVSGSEDKRVEAWFTVHVEK